MKARAKRIDDGEYVEGSYTHVSNHPLFPLYGITPRYGEPTQINPSTLEYQIGNKWYTMEELERAVNTSSPQYGSKELIGKARDRFKELEHKGWDWKSYYNGWIEGRVNMLEEIKGGHDKPASDNTSIDPDG